MNQTRHERLPFVAEVCADEAAILALSVLRFVASGYLTGDVACWDAAHDGAERLLGARDGSRLVAAMTALMRALRAERHQEWGFLPASCCRVTPPEQRLARCLDLARAGREGEAAEEVERLAGGAAPRLRAALEVAAQLLNALPSDLTRRAEAAARPIGVHLH